MAELKDIFARMAGLTECYALNTYLRSAEQWDTSLFYLKKGKQGIEFEERTIEEENLNTKLLILSIYGNQCLVRNKKSADQAVEALVPGIAIDDFHYQENEQQIALIRKNTYEQVIDQLKLSKAVIIGVHLLPRQQVFEAFRQKGTIWGNLLIDGQNVSPSQELSEWELTNGKSISSREVPALAEGYHYLNTYGVLNDSVLKGKNKDFSAYKAFHIGWKAAIAVLLIALSINFYLFNSVSKELDKTSYKIQQNERWVKEAEELKEAYTKRKDFIESRGLNKRTINAYIIDQVCAPIEKGLRLEKLITKPYTNKNGNLSLSDEGITITGHTYKNSTLSDYISELKRLTWVDKVELINFHKDPTKDYAVFNIEVTRKND